MMRSLYSGVSGLQNHQVKMDVVGNNISNVNTIGFKRGRVNFQDMISQQMGGAVKPNDQVGGINPKQIGLGMSVASIDTIHTQGSLQTTGVTTDLAIQGDGFFVMKAGVKDYFTRAGAFGLDRDGTLVNPANGMRVQGWTAENIDGENFINTSGQIGDLKIPIGGKDPAAQTLDVDLACNLDKRTPLIPVGATQKEVLDGTWTVDKNIYDSFGNIHRMSVDFARVPGTNNQWNGSVTIDGDDTNTLINLGNAGNDGNTFTVTFDNLGAITNITDAQGDALNEDGAAARLQVGFDVLDGNPDGAGNPLRQNFNLNLGTFGSYEKTVTQFAETSSTKAWRQNGYGMGYLESFKINQDGNILGVYTNGSNKLLGKVAMASFTNPGGLEKAGETNFIESTNSGEPNVGPSGIAGKGKFVAGALEMSNVDLAEQFTEMIITQRGFQANSRTITTSDAMLQEILSLKR